MPRWISVFSISPGNFRPINAFYPTDLNQTICPTGYSLTIWFNVGHPQSNTSGDEEDMNIILDQNPTAMCRIPFRMQAQSINSPTSDSSVQWRLSDPDSTLHLISFRSLAPLGVDFRVRYCCPIGSFVSPTITTTPMPLDSNTCGKQAIAPQSKLLSRIFGGMDAIPNSWPWVSFQA